MKKCLLLFFCDGSYLSSTVRQVVALFLQKCFLSLPRLFKILVSIFWILSIVHSPLTLIGQDTTPVEEPKIIEPIDSLSIFNGRQVLFNYKNLYWYEDNLELNPEIIGSDSFQVNFKHHVAQDTFKKGKTYWIRISFKNEYGFGIDMDRFYLVGGVHGETQTVYIKDHATGKYISKTGGYHVPVRERQNKDSFFWWFFSGIVMELPILPQEHLTYYIKIQPAYDFNFYMYDMPFMTISLGDFQEGNLWAAHWILLYLGFLTMMVFYSIGLYGLIREASFLYYALFCFCMLIHNASSYHIFEYVITDFFPNQPVYSLSFRVTIYIAIFSFLYFIRTYLGLAKVLPTWDKIFKGLGIFCLLFVPIELYFIFSDDSFPFQWGMLKRMIPLSVLAAIVVIVFLIPLWRLQTGRKYFLLLGILSLLVGVLYVAYKFFLTGRMGTITYFPMLFFSALETVFFALGLAYRIKENEGEKQAAFMQLRVAELEQQSEKIERERLQKMNELKTKLYTNITHEFRTPLTVIQGMAEQIKQPLYSQETHLIRRNSKNLLQLVNQLLDLSKLESGNLVVHKMQGDVIPYLRYISESFQSFAANKNIHFTITTTPTEVVMDYDEEKLLNIVSNLLFNAIKFTPENGQVTLKAGVVGAANKHLQIVVTDTGIGIEEQHLPYIFDRFYQADSSTTRKESGTGIGLAITHELIQLLKGQIQVKSQINRGTTFEVLLPITNEATLHNTSYDGEVPDLLPTSSLTTVTEAANLIADKELPLLLLIEDNEDVLHYLIACLKGNYQIITALNGQQGIDTALSRIPDLIISDVMMPEMDGYEVCANLKTADTTSHIPIILLTAKVDQASKIEGLQQGADAYLAKPFDQEELEVRIEQLLSQRKQLQAYYTQSTTAQQIALPPIQDTFIQKVVDLVERNLSADLPLDQLYQALNKSQSQVYRKIKAVTGYSTSIFIRRIRLKQAHRLLISTDLSISEIAYEVGFKDPNFFSKCFSDVFGRSPSDIRSIQGR